MASAAMPQPVDDFPSEKDGKVLHPDLLNESVKKTQYAVRGELYLRAMELQSEGKKIIFTNGAQRCCHQSAACVAMSGRLTHQLVSGAIAMLPPDWTHTAANNLHTVMNGPLGVPRARCDQYRRASQSARRGTALDLFGPYSADPRAP